ncbi:MAG: hypothetical protein Q9162_004609 [Coniocarpon cinnabarinum]
MHNFARLKKRLLAGREDEVEASWNRLLESLREEISIVTSLGSNVIPEIDFQDIDNPSHNFTKEHKKRGVAVIRNVLPEQEALSLKEELRRYIRDNPLTKAFPPENPQVYELYWSPSQMKARGHPNLMKAYRFLLQHWHSKDPLANISVAHPTIYADRLRMRTPGDSRFALGPHVDGGSVERWEEEGYGLGNVYDSVFQGRWEEYDPWEISCRLPVKSDRYNGIGACSMFRALQGWLSLSTAGPFEGTLLVNPLLGLATSYYLLRPFFAPRQEMRDSLDDFLEPRNWKLQAEPDSWLQGATPGHGQELRTFLHPHLRLDSSMVHVPTVRPGDYVSWHCDTIHAVDQVHMGRSDSSVLYIPTCPLTELNAEYMLRQRRAFLDGTPGPDFPGGVGETKHVGKPNGEDVAEWTGVDGMRGFGLEAFDSSEPNLTIGQRQVMDRANKVLEFYS